MVWWAIWINTNGSVDDFVDQHPVLVDQHLVCVDRHDGVVDQHQICVD